MESSPRRVSRHTREKALALVRHGKVSLDRRAGGGTYFTIKSTSEHEVIYRPRSEKWLCDCRWSSLHPDRFCSHIIAAQMLLNLYRKQV